MWIQHCSNKLALTCSMTWDIWSSSVERGSSPARCRPAAESGDAGMQPASTAYGEELLACHYRVLPARSLTALIHTQTKCLSIYSTVTDINCRTNRLPPSHPHTFTQSTSIYVHTYYIHTYVHIGTSWTILSSSSVVTPGFTAFSARSSTSLPSWGMRKEVRIWGMHTHVPHCRTRTSHGTFHSLGPGLPDTPSPLTAPLCWVSVHIPLLIGMRAWFYGRVEEWSHSVCVWESISKMTDTYSMQAHICTYYYPTCMLCVHPTHKL